MDLTAIQQLIEDKAPGAGIVATIVMRPYVVAEYSPEGLNLLGSWEQCSICNGDGRAKRLSTAGVPLVGGKCKDCNGIGAVLIGQDQVQIPFLQLNDGGRTTHELQLKMGDGRADKWPDASDEAIHDFVVKHVHHLVKAQRGKGT